MEDQYTQWNPVVEHQREYRYEQHRKKLQSISSTTIHGSTLKGLKERNRLLNRVKNNRVQNREFQDYETWKVNKKKNQALLDRLVDISSGSKLSIPQPMNWRKRSLNDAKRKQEKERIDRENREIAKRLVGKKSKLSASVMSRDFRDHRSHVKNLEKFRQQKNAALHLPPIDTNRSVGLSSSASPISKISHNSSKKRRSFSNEQTPKTKPLRGNHSTKLLKDANSSTEAGGATTIQD